MQQEQEFQYMLTELEIKSESLSRQIERFERLGNFYLTGVTAIVGALVVVATSTLLGQYTALASALTLLAFAGFGASIYLRMSVSKAGIASAYARIHSIRLYFTKRFPATAGHVENIAPSDLYQTWRIAVFSTQVISLFAIMNFASGLALTLSAGILLIQAPSLIGLRPFELSFVIIGSIAVFFLFELFLFLHMRSQMKRAQRLNRAILDASCPESKSTDNAE
jgi:hypothetical protein